MFRGFRAASSSSGAAHGSGAGGGDGGGAAQQRRAATFNTDSSDDDNRQLRTPPPLPSLKEQPAAPPSPDALPLPSPNHTSTADERSLRPFTQKRRRESLADGNVSASASHSRIQRAFDDDDEDRGAAADDGNGRSHRPAPADDDDDADDELDAYMKTINQQAEKGGGTHRAGGGVAPAPSSKHAAPRGEESAGSARENGDDEDDDDDDDDPVTSYVQFRAEAEDAAMKSRAATDADRAGEDRVALNASEDAHEREEEEEEEHSAGEPERPPGMLDMLPVVDHGAIAYAPFAKNFYQPHPEVAAESSPHLVDALRREIGVKVSGQPPLPGPVRTFSQLSCLGRDLLEAVRRVGFEAPTEIQSQAIPVVLSGRDVIGIAKTGSGKTAAFVLPLLVHALDQPRVQRKEGPIGLIVAPTRELAAQIAHEAKRFSRAVGAKVTLIVGGDPKFEQYKALRDGGAEIVVGTPGRLLDMIKMKACTLERCTYLVLDEADRMFDMGFEPQVRALLGLIRPDRQALLFSATFKPSVERLAAAVLQEPVRIVVGSVGAANENVSQVVEVFHREEHKFAWLLRRVDEFRREGSVVIFSLTRGSCAELANKLRMQGHATSSIHGETDQADRDGMLQMFKRREVDLLVATDIAARGLDIKHVKTVINYEPAKNMDWHTHRVGRTGRAGEHGTAYTLLLTPRDSRFADSLQRAFAQQRLAVPPALAALAAQQSRSSKGGGRQGGDRGEGGGGGGGGGGGARNDFAGGGARRPNERRGLGGGTATDGSDARGGPLQFVRGGQ